MSYIQYYLPYHEMDNKKCLPCNIIETYTSCFREKDYAICLSCKLKYNLIDNKWEEKNEQICKIGEKENAKHAKIFQNYKINVKPIMKDIIYQKTIIRLFVNIMILKDALYV